MNDSEIEVFAKNFRKLIQVILSFISLTFCSDGDQSTALHRWCQIVSITLLRETCGGLPHVIWLACTFCQT